MPRTMFTPSVGTTTHLNTFWHKVQRWTTNCFSVTPTGILLVESCLPPVSLLITHRERLAALRVVSSPQQCEPATGRLHPSFASLSVHQADDSSRALTRGLTSVYLPFYWRTPRPIPLIRNHLPVDAVTHRTLPVTHGLSKMPMIHSPLVSPPPTHPPQALMNNTYSTLKKRVREALLHEWASLFLTPVYYHQPPALAIWPFMGLGEFIAGTIYQIRAGKSYLAAYST